MKGVDFVGDKLCPLLLAANPSNVGGKAVCKREECAIWKNGGCGLIVAPANKKE